MGSNPIGRNDDGLNEIDNDVQVASLSKANEEDA